MMKKVLSKIAIALIAVILLAGIAAGILFGNEIASVMSFRQLRARDDENRDGSVYGMDIKGGYYLDDFVRQGGVKNDKELIAFVTGHITKGLYNVGFSAPEIGCSSFTARTANGDMLLARNYDMSKSNIVIVRTDPGNGRHASVSVASLNFLGIDADKDVGSLFQKITALAAAYAPLDGMNDAGVSCGIYMTYQGKETVATDQNTERPDMTSTTFLRMVLDYADDLDDAVEIAGKYDMHDSAGTSYHYMVADATGRSAVFEWIADTDASDNDGGARKLVITYNDDDARLGEDEASAAYQWVTNFVIAPGYYDNEEDMNGLDRYREIASRLKSVDGTFADEREAMKVLQAVGRRNWPGSKSVTVHSVIYNLTDLTAYVVPNEHYDDASAWFEYHLK